MTCVRRAEPRDLAAIVDLHLESFRGFFLTSLGPRFLKRFYGAVLREPGCVCLVAEDGKGLSGFAMGPLQPRGFFRHLFIRQGLRFAADALPALLARPGIVAAQLIRGARYRGEPPPKHRDAALLSSIAVRRSAARSGVASALVEGFCQEAAGRRASLVYLTTDRDDNAAANRFYVKHGFHVQSVIIRSTGRVMNRYVRHLYATTNCSQSARR